jgi:serine/threonine protein phosphatase PrpC
MFSASSSVVPASRHHARPYRLVCSGKTHIGWVREENQDRFGVHPEVGLFLVADGMGGAAAGGVAAQIAVDVVHQAVFGVDATWPRGMAEPAGNGLSELVAAIECANSCIHGRAAETPGWLGMGTTIAALLARDHRVALAHVGDSRILRLRGSRLDLMTEDHSLFNELVRRGLADPHHPEAFEHQNVITRALGTDKTVEVEGRWVDDVAPGDTFLLCSDGLSGVVDQRDLARILLEYPDLDDAVEELIHRANQNGGLDNMICGSPAQVPFMCTLPALAPVTFPGLSP